ncbi:MAG TPA: hypothetical protein VMH79_14640 [Thermoanaerobaculia bacterium]|nr:hypothetical protein [Thermoanaerobaculia bacterium]
MKKALIACLAVAALFAVAGSASAITCTLDQRPAATLLVPYFQVSTDGNGGIVSSGALARDTIVTIVNASSAPMVAHVNVYDRFSVIQLDFNVALSGFDVQSMAMSQIITGHLPVTLNSVGDDVCQRGADIVYGEDARDGYLRVSPTSPVTGESNPATPLDNVNGTTDYTGTFFSIASALTINDCDGDTDASGLAIGYIVIDHANYCNLSDPTDPNYYINDAIGMENNLFGEIIFTSGNGLPTYGISTVNLEADTTLGDATLAWAQDEGQVARTFYARYLDLANEVQCNNCSSPTAHYNLADNAPWDEGFGDQREPLGLRWASRWFDLTSSGIITTNFMVWRGGDGTLGCDETEPVSTEVFWDEDENTVSQGVCPSPCTSPQYNFPLETQQTNIIRFVHPTGTPAGWVQVDFSGGSPLDQAWMAYSFEGSVALESVLIQGTQLDPSACDPLNVSGVAVIAPVVPSIPTGIGR